jgi:hypothetical protein
MKRKLGKQIVVIDSGFVHLGDCTLEEGYLVIENGYNIRVWGTTEGLSQLVSGPLAATKADKLSKVVVPFSRVIFFLEVTGGWR